MGDETLCRRCQSRPRAPGDGQTMCARCLEASAMNRARVRLHKVPLRGDLCTMVESESIAALVDRQPADRAESAADYDSGDLVLEALHRALEPEPGQDRPTVATIMADLEHADLEEADDALSRFLKLPGELEPWHWRPITIAGRPSLAAWRRVVGDRPSLIPLEALHATWVNKDREKELPHPALALVRAWRDRPRKVTPFRPVHRATLPRLHRAPAAEAVRLPGFALAVPAPRDLATLPGFEPYTSGVPSWVLSMFDQSGASSAQRGRMGAPWSMRLWVCAALHVDVHDRTGRSVTLPTTLGDIERWIWPNGWPRANRKRDWPVFRQRLIHLGTIRPRIIGRDGTAYLIRVVDAPAVPEEWDRTKPCPLVVSIPAAAAAGAAVNWPALLRYGADSPGMFRAYLATVAVLDYSARKGQSITRDIPAVVLSEDGKPKRGKGGKLKRNPAVRVENPAARFVGSLRDEELRQMLGFPDHREYRARARRCMERLHADGVIDLDRRQDGRVRIFAPGPVVGDGR